jgi:predicted 3-demethylubiquinone-9 3-methyltransferase (glyoxalase superfamily)
MSHKITPFLWFDGNAEEAIEHYLSIFKNGKLLDVTRRGGAVFTATFEIEGQQFMALNGGPHFKFSEAISLYVDCETQAEVDELWGKLCPVGSLGRCGWLKDKFGLSWQIIPRGLGELLQDPDPEKAKRVMDAMLEMSKIDIQALRKAHAG